MGFSTILYLVSYQKGKSSRSDGREVTGTEELEMLAWMGEHSKKVVNTSHYPNHSSFIIIWMEREATSFSEWPFWIVLGRRCNTWIC